MSSSYSFLQHTEWQTSRVMWQFRFLGNEVRARGPDNLSTSMSPVLAQYVTRHHPPTRTSTAVEFATSLIVPSSTVPLPNRVFRVWAQCVSSEGTVEIHGSYECWSRIPPKLRGLRWHDLISALDPLGATQNTQ